MVMLCNLCLSGFFYKNLNKRFNNQLFWSNVLPNDFHKLLNDVSILYTSPKSIKSSKYIDFCDDTKYIVIDENQYEDKCNISPKTYVVELKNDIHIIYPHYNSIGEIISKYESRKLKNTNDDIVVVFYAFPFFEDDDIKKVINNPYKTVIISTRNLEHLLDNTEKQAFIKIDNIHHNHIKDISDACFNDVINVIENKFSINTKK